MNLDVNEGDRPSRLALDRYAAGELTGEERKVVEAWLADHPEGKAHMDALEAAKRDLPAFDADLLRRRAAQQGTAEVPAAANRPFRWTLLAPLIVAAAFLGMLLIPGPPSAEDITDPSGIRIKGETSLQVFDGTPLRPYRGSALGEGDVVGFRVAPGPHDGVVLLSVDGSGTVSVFWPVEGDDPLPLEGADVPLPGTVTLDDAPGPEVFVAFFDTPASEAKAALQAAWQSGGAEAVVELADTREDANAQVVQRR